MSSEVEPRVTVLMSVYNGEKHLREAVDSILNQTFRDFEFLIIEDGSSDGTAEILESYDDPRMRIVYSEENIGLTRSLNKGLKLARGEYIARMDADDISLPERLEKQVEFLDAHPEVGVLGTWAEAIEESGVSRETWRFPITSSLIAWSLIFANCLAHPSVMMRRDVMQELGAYRAWAVYAQDYELWSRAIFATRLANLPDVLLKRRVFGDTIGVRHAQKQEQVAVKVMHSLITALLGSEVAIETVQSLRQFLLGQPLTSSQQIESVASLVRKLCRAYLKANALRPDEAREITRDTAAKLATMAKAARSFSKLSSLIILTQAARLDQRLLPAFTRRIVLTVFRASTTRAFIR